MKNRHNPKIKEPFLWLAIGLMITLTLIAFSAIGNARQQQIEYSFKENVFGINYLLMDKITHSVDKMNSISTFYNASQRVERSEFSQYVSQLFKGDPSSVAFSWSPLVPRADRPAFEQLVRHQGVTDFFIYEAGPNGEKIPAAERDEYFPVEIIEPATSGDLLGFDNGSSQERLQTIYVARDSGQPVFSPPLQLLQSESDTDIGLLLMVPIYRRGAPVESAADRRASLQGVVVNALEMDELVQDAISHITMPDVELYLFDVTDPDRPGRFMGFFPSISGPQSLPPGDPPHPYELQTGLHETITWPIAGREWLLVARPGPAYGANHINWAQGFTLLAGLSVIGAMLAYVFSQRKTAATLAHSEAEFRAMADSALAGVMRSDLAGNILYANKSVARMFGFDTVEAFCTTQLIHHINDPAQFEAANRRLLAGEQIHNQEIEIITAGGETRWLLFSAALYQGVVSGTIIDITDRIQAENERRQYSGVLAQMADTVVITNVDGVIQYVNAAFERLSGYSRDEVIGQTPRLLKSDQHEPEFYKWLWDTILSGQAFQAEIINRRKDGELFHEVKTITPLRDASGKISHFVATGKDITSRKKMAKALRQKETEYQLIAENTGDVIWLLDLDSQEFTYVSPSVEKLRGYTPQEVMTQSMRDSLTPDSFAKLETLLPKRLQAFQSMQDYVAVTYTDELDQTRKDGTIVNTEISSTFVRNEAGNIQVVGISRDVTERKQAAAALAESRQKLEATLNALPDLLFELNQNRCIIDFRAPDTTWLYAPPEYFVGRSVNEILPPEAAVVVDQALTEAKQTGNHAGAVYSLPGKNGLEWFELSIATKPEPGKDQPHFIVLARNITERKRTEEALFASEEQYRTLINSQDAAIATVDADGIFHYMNQVGAAPFSCTPADLVGRRLHDFFPPSVADWQLDQVRRVITAGEGLVTEYQGNLAGRPNWRRVSVQPIRNAAGQVVLAMINSMDITERILATEQLQESERRLKQAQQIARIGSWELDLVNNRLNWSDETYRLFGLKPHEFTATYEAFLDAIHPEDREWVRQAYDYSVKARQPYEIVHRLLLPDGTLKYVREKCETTYVDDGQPLRSVGTVQDITEQRQMELAVRERVKELTGLFAVSRLLDDHSLTEAEICRQILELLPPSMQFPELTAPVIELNGQRYGNLADNKALPRLTSVITVNREIVGWLSVYYTEDKPFILPEEQELIDNISRMLGLWLEQRQAEGALRASEERFRQLADNIKEGFWLYDLLEEKTIYLSPAYAEIWGRPLAQLLQYPDEYLSAIVPEDRPLLLAAQARHPYGTPVDVEYRIQQPDGSVRWVWDRSFPIFNESGQVVRIAGVVTDITNEQLTKRELEALNRDLEQRVEERTAEVRQSEATYRALFENSNDAIFLLSPNGEELNANQHALDMVGYTLEEWAKQPIPEDQKGLHDSHFQAVLRGEQVPLFERIFIAKDGHRIDVEINLSAIYDAAGNIYMVQSVVRDITQRKQAEINLRESRDQLSAANAALEKASRMKDEFLASMSHELRTPLTGILGLAEVLEMQIYGELNDKQLKAVSTIAGSGQHLLELINDILDLSKIEAGKLEMEFEDCAVSEICQASLQLTKGMAHQKRQQVAFSMDPMSITITADPRRLKQMLVNLLSNAIKFTPEGGQLGLEVQSSEAEQLVRLTVWDEGIGIKPEDMGNLFRPFTQLDSSLARQHAGTGLGLSLVQRMAELHNGSISVESQPGQGSRFTLALPYRPAKTDELQAGSAADDCPARGDIAPSGASVLLAEDSETNIQVLQSYLTAQGYQVTVARNGHEALALAVSIQPDLILMDIQMPLLDGLETTRRLRANAAFAETPIIALTALAMPGDRERCLTAGASEYLAKPVSMKGLIQTIERLR